MSQAKVLTDLEHKRVLAVVDAQAQYARRNRLAVQLTFLAGLRAAEVAALKLHDVIDENGRVFDRVHLSAEQTKGRKGRTFFVSKKLQTEIRKYCQTIPASDLRRPLIQSQKGGHFSPTTMVMLFRRIYDLAGLTDARSHSGRRSFVTRIANKGVGIRTLQHLAGHSSIQTTARYIDVNDEMLSAAVELV